MTSSTLVCASWASSTPFSSTGAGTSSGPNVNGCPVVVIDRVVPWMNTLACPPRNLIVGLLPVAHGPMSVSEGLLKPIVSMRMRRGVYEAVRPEVATNCTALSSGAATIVGHGTAASGA